MSPSTLPAPVSRTLPPTPARRGPLLVATDGRAGVGALRAASHLAARSGRSVEVLAVFEPLPMYFGPIDVTRMPPQLEVERWDLLLSRVRRQLHEVLGPEVAWPVEVRQGDPAAVIAEVARERAADLIVVGAGRYHVLDRLLAEQTALRVIRHADRPVLTVPEAYDGLPESIVVATDFSPASAHAVEVALGLAEPGATLHLVHAWSPGAAAGAMLGDVLPLPTALQSVVDEYARALPGRFARLRTLLTDRPDVTVVTHTVDERAAPGILAYAHAHGASFVAAGRHGRPFIERLFVGSVTSALVRGAECAVLVTPEPSAVDAERLERALTGASSGTDPATWRTQLDGFAHRNNGRPAVLTVDDPSLGARTPVTQAFGYALLGATYDPHDARVDLMFGTTFPGRPHLTRAIGSVDAVTVLSDRDGRDLGLRVRHGRGQTQIAFLLGPPPAMA